MRWHGASAVPAGYPGRATGCRLRRLPDGPCSAESGEFNEFGVESFAVRRPSTEVHCRTRDQRTVSDDVHPAPPLGMTANFQRRPIRISHSWDGANRAGLGSAH